MSDPLAERDDVSRGPTLSSDGTLEGRLSRVEPAVPASPAAQEAPLELAEVAPPPIQPLPVRDDGQRRRGGVKFVIGAFGLGLLILVASLVRSVISPPPGSTREDEVRALGSIENALAVNRGHAVIQSEPAGASITFNGHVVGVTPWAGDNTFGTQPIELRLAGYRTWAGALPDKPDATLSILLTK